MKKIKLLLLWIVSILWISFSSASYFSWWVEYQNWIYRNATNWILTLIYNDKVISITDKYLWQNTYYFSWNTYQLDFSDLNIYARWNNHNFSDLVFDYVVPNDFDFSSYWPWNYFDSWATYFYRDWYSDSVVNITWYDNLRWWEDNTPDSRKGSCYVWWHMFNDDEANLLYDILLWLVDFNSYNIYDIFFITYTYNNVYYPDWNAWTKIRFPSLFWWIDEPFTFSSFEGSQLSFLDSEARWSFAPVRCVRNAVILPTSNNRTLEYQGSLENLPEEVDPPINDNSWSTAFDLGVLDPISFFIEKAVLCYMSSWSFDWWYGSCSNIDYESFINQYLPFYSSWSWSSVDNYYWSLRFKNAEPILYNYCLNNAYVVYPFCDDLSIYSWVDMLYTYENWQLQYLLLWSWFSIVMDNIWSWVLDNFSCQGAWCPNYPNTWFIQINTDSTWDWLSWYELIWFYSWSYVWESFYWDYFDKWYFFKCPYNVKKYISFWSWIDDTLKQYSPSYPINCFISSFEAWRNLLLFKNSSWEYWSWSLINWNSDNHQRLFTFFDIILSLWLIVVIWKLFNLLSNSWD